MQIYYDPFGQSLPFDFGGVPFDFEFEMMFLRDEDDYYFWGVAQFVFSPWVDLGSGNDSWINYYFENLANDLDVFGREGNDYFELIGFARTLDNFQPFENFSDGWEGDVFLNGGRGDDDYLIRTAFDKPLLGRDPVEYADEIAIQLDLQGFDASYLDTLAPYANGRDALKFEIFDYLGENTVDAQIGGQDLEALDLDVILGRNSDDAIISAQALELDGFIRLGNGVNMLDMDASAFETDITIKGGNNTDAIAFDYGALNWDDVIAPETASSEIEIFTFAGHDRVTVSAASETAHLDSDLLVFTGFGDDTVTVDISAGSAGGAPIDGNHVINGGTGNDVITILGDGIDLGTTVIGGTGNDIISSDSMVGSLRGGVGADTFILTFTGFRDPQSINSDSINARRLIVDFDEKEGDRFVFRDFDPFGLGQEVEVSSFSDLQAFANAIDGKLIESGDDVRLLWDTGFEFHPTGEILFTDILA